MLNIIKMRSADLIPYAFNNRKHPEQQIDRIANSIKEFGFNQPIVIDESNVVLVGHGRLAAALKLGLEEVPVVKIESLSEAKKKAYRILDNKLQNDSEWDFPNLELEIGQLEELGFELEPWGLDTLIPTSEEEPETYEDGGAGELPDEPYIKEGDVIELGPHRIMCGDSCSAEDVAALMNGAMACLVVTSPPYNQSIESFKPSGMHKPGGWVEKVGKLAYQDSLDEGEYQKQQVELLRVIDGALDDGASIFYNHKNRYREKAIVSPLYWLKDGPFTIRQEIIWSRPGSITQNARMFLPSDERIYWLYKGNDFYFNDKTEIKSYSSVWDIGLETNKTHAVAFPLEIPLRCIRSCSKIGENILEPYCGSGTTLIAADQLGRICYGMEISPAYCQVILERYQKHCVTVGKPFVCKINGEPFIKPEL